MRKYALLIGSLSLLFFLSPSKAEEAIDWNEAHQYYGQYVTVKGKIVGTYNSGKACFLNFHPDYKKYFTAVIFASAFHKFPSNSEDYYYGKEVHITGKIKKYKGKPEIILNDQSQIKVIGESTDSGNAPEIISWKEAHLYYGKTVTVEGEVVAAYNSGKACFLNFHRNWKKYFTGVIFVRDFKNFSPVPEVKYKGRKVRITGLVKEYQGKPEIIVRHPSQVEILK